MRTSYLLALGFLWLTPAAAQRITFGVVGGTRISNDFPITDVSQPADAYGDPANRFQYRTGDRSFIFGATVELALTDRLSIGASVLRRPMNTTIVFTEYSPSGAVTRNEVDHYLAVDAWEFPVLLKYRFAPSRALLGARPFVEAGPSFRSQENASAVEPSRFGLSAGAGVVWHLRRFRIAPEIRYTRWDREHIAPRYPTRPDQIEFLTTFAYETDEHLRQLGGRSLRLGGLAGYSPIKEFGLEYGQKVIERAGYLAGISLEWPLSERFSIEASGIYKPLRAGSDTPDVQTPFSVVTWQFPALAKYRLGAVHGWRPIVEAGPSFRLAGNLNGYNPSHYGVTAGVGVERALRGLRISPIVRYTRWAADPSRYSWQRVFMSTHPNALELILAASI